MSDADEEWRKWVRGLIASAVADYGFSTYAAATIDEEAFRPMYDDGLTPREAMAEDFRNA